MIIFEHKGFQTHSLFPDTDWTGEALFVVPDGSELAGKIMAAAPWYDFVIEDDKLVDIVETERPAPPEPSPSELREQAYQAMTHKENGEELLLWGGDALTVDGANDLWLKYTAEGSDQAVELTRLIAAAKSYIRELYPDTEM